MRLLPLHSGHRMFGMVGNPLVSNGSFVYTIVCITDKAGDRY
jgi:hypothetical protein